MYLASGVCSCFLFEYMVPVKFEFGNTFFYIIQGTVAARLRRGKLHDIRIPPPVQKCVYYQALSPVTLQGLPAQFLQS